MSPTILLFIGGIGMLELLILAVTLSVAGFFIWRVLLKYLFQKGQQGVNIAAVIITLVQTPVLIFIAGALISWVSISNMDDMRDEAIFDESQEEVDTTSFDFPDINGIDVLAVSPDKVKVLLENEYVRVLEYTLAPGEKDNPHTHPPKSYYVVAGGTLRVFPETGEPFDTEEKEGTVEWSGFVGKHYVENVGKTTVKLVLTEVKDAM